MERKYQFNDFSNNNTWLIFRRDIFIQDDPMDIYIIMDLPSGLLLSYEIAETQLSQKQVESLLEKALFKKGEAPKQILVANNDPIEPMLQRPAQNLRVTVKIVPAMHLEDLTEEVVIPFHDKFDDPTPHNFSDFENDSDDVKSAKRSIPDSYDLCSCSSGLKYKFCCKRIFIETIEAMCCAEEGKFKEALEWISKMRKLVGNTSEVLCREAIVYSFFDRKKSKEILKQCLEINPKHPRAHYLYALELKEVGDFQAAIAAYEKAVSYYPSTDHYHLNEVYNNLGVIHYEMGDIVKAKLAFELALHFMPSDKLTRRNLKDFIYSKEGK